MKTKHMYLKTDSLDQIVTNVETMAYADDTVFTTASKQRTHNLNRLNVMLDISNTT